MTQLAWETILETKVHTLSEAEQLQILRLEALRYTAPWEIISKFRETSGEPFSQEEMPFDSFFSFPRIPLLAQLAEIYFSMNRYVPQSILRSDCNAMIKSVILAALKENQCVGGIWYEPYDRTRKVIPTHIIVKEKYRHQGIGSSLEEDSSQYLETLTRFASPLISQVCWPVLAHETSPRWFENRGYTVEQQGAIYCAQKRIK